MRNNKLREGAKVKYLSSLRPDFQWPDSRLLDAKGVVHRVQFVDGAKVKLDVPPGVIDFVEVIWTWPGGRKTALYSHKPWELVII